MAGPANARPPRLISGTTNCEETTALRVMADSSKHDFIFDCWCSRVDVDGRLA